MRIWSFRLLVSVLLGSTFAHAQFVAYNDDNSCFSGCTAGWITGPNVTTYSGNSAAGPGSGFLTNVANGVRLNAQLTLTAAGNVVYEGSQAEPASGTPLYINFNNYCDFQGTPNPSVALTGAGATYTYRFSGLDQNKRYIFRGGAVRGGGYTLRWTLCELQSADSATPAHTGAATGNSTNISPTQAAFNFGANDAQGDMCSWENINPGADGTFSVVCSQYFGPLPGGGTGGDSKGYAITAVRLEEINTTPAAPVITAQPQNTSAPENTPASFSVTATGNPAPTYQWYKNNNPLSDGTNSTYNIPSAQTNDNGAVFKVEVQNTTNGVLNTVTSGNATLTVIPDTTAPTIFQASSVSTNQVLVTFSELVTETSATNTPNYAITNLTSTLIISNAVLQANGSNVVLTTSGQTAGATYTLRVNGIRDRSAAANQIAANSTASFTTAAGYTRADIGAPGIAGTVTPVSGGVDVAGSGADLGGTTDQFTFGYQQRSGDFDIKIRLQGLTLADVWTKAALMARQNLNANSAYAAAIATPSASGCLFQVRPTAGGASTNGPGSLPANYPDTWLRLKRAGNLYTGYAGFDGATWVTLGAVNLALTDPIYFGLAVSSHTNSSLATAQFRDQDAVTSATVVGSLPMTSEPLGASTRRSYLTISEIMYHPKTGSEFVEIYNSSAFFEKIGGYRLSGDIDYTFPANTIIPAGGFIVVAEDPGLLQGSGTILGPYDGSLPNDNGTVRLRNRQGAVLLEVNYGSRHPWPVAPDGAGPSLVLAHASYGEGNPKAWSPSDRVGGSPGAGDPLAPSGRTVCINEIMAHTESGANDFIELYNHGNLPVDLSGAWLTDDPETNKFRIPNGTTIASNGFLYYSQATLGFALDAGGEQLFLISSNLTRVLDAVAFGPTANDVSIGRLPDGAGIGPSANANVAQGSPFRELATPTPATPNREAGPKTRDIVINEIMYDPISGNDNDEYLELYNKGSTTVNLAGWRFTDGIDYTFPSNTLITAGSYLVIAKNTNNLLAPGRYPALNTANTLGNYDGTLANGGEHIALAMPEPDITTNNIGAFVTNTIYVVVNELTYMGGGSPSRWGRWAHGGGSSLELVDPRSDNTQSANWADSDESTKAQWVNFETTLGIGETLGSPVNDNLELFLLGIGECMLDDVELHNSGGANIVQNPGFESGTANWVLQGSHDFSTVEPGVGYPSGGSALHLRAASRGDNGANRIRTTTIAISGTVTLRAKARWLRGWPELMMRVHGGGVEVTGKLLPNPGLLALGTPGAPNSKLKTPNILTANAGPAIYDVTHTPALPAPNEPVTITAKISDPDPLLSLTLRFRADGSSTYTSSNMVDNGTGADALPGDGIYTAVIPGQAAGATIAFYIQAADTGNPLALPPVPSATNTFPQDLFPPSTWGVGGTPGVAPSLPRCFPNDAIARECVLRWGDTQMPGNFPTYHLWVTTANANRWQSRDPLNNSVLDATFLYNNYRPIYNETPLYAGSPWHRGQMTTGPAGGQRVDYVVNYPEDDLFLGQTDSVLNNPGNPGGTSTSDTSAQTEQTSYLIFNELGVVYNHRRYVHVFLNGSQRSTTSGRTGNFIMEDSQQPNGDMIDEWFHGDTDGDLYKIEDWFEFNDNGYDFSSNNDADLYRRLVPGSSQLATAPYRFMFRRRSLNSGESASDYTSFFQVINAVSPTSTSQSSAENIDFPATDAILDWDQWMRIFAVQHAVGNWDSYGYRRGKNDYMYKPTGSAYPAKFQQMTWDIDFTMGVGGDGATQALSGDETDQRTTAMRREPAILRGWWRAYYEICYGSGGLGNYYSAPLSRAYMDPILDAKQAALQANNINVDPATVNTIKNYITARQNYISNQLNTVYCPLVLTTNATFSTTNNLLTLNGGAPVNAKYIRINGIDYPLRWTSVSNFTIYLPLDPGLNNLTLAGYDLNGNLISGLTTNLAVTYNGPQIQPQGAVVINELMYNPTATNAEYIEIYNSSPIASFDLSNWRIDGLDYTFPGGTIISNKQILLIVKNRTAFSATFGAGIPVFAEFDGNFDPDGEKISLIKPAKTPNDEDQTIDAVRYEPFTPWPTAANGAGSALQLIDSGEDNSRVANWSDGSGWRYHTTTAQGATTATIPLSTNLFTFTMDSAGDFYIDDVVLVAGTVAGVGPNLFQNGDFETGLGPWVALDNHSGSALSTSTKHSGNASLHIISTGVGSSGTPLRAVAQSNIVITTTNFYTISFWYLPSANANNVNYRLTSNFRTGVNPPAAISLKPSFSSPSSNNTIAASIESFSLLWINEIQPTNTTGVVDSANQHDPWIEIYNSGTNTIFLDGYALSDNYLNLGQWPFPSGASIGPKQFRVIFADNQPGQSTGIELHTNFRLNPTNGSIVLSQPISSGLRVLDYINYSGIALDYSYGSFPDGQATDRQLFYYVTAGGTNNGSPVPVTINEWVASNTDTNFLDPANGRPEDWIELYNFGTDDIDLSGFYMTDNLGQKRNWQMPPGTHIGPKGFLLVWADNAATNSTPNDLHASFQLGRNGEEIGLFTPAGLTVDAIKFGFQQDNISQGRYADGNVAGVLYFMTTTTPLATNKIPTNLSAPNLPAIANRTINERSTLAFTNVASDADVPVQTLSYILEPGAPLGASLRPNTGPGGGVIFSWTPTEAQGGASYPITISVTDNGSPPLTNSKSFTVTVNKVNSPPDFAPLAPRTIPENALLSFAVAASDSDLPAQQLTYSLAGTVPTGATLDPDTGVFSWTPSETQGPSTNTFQVRVSDNGSPSASTTQALTITVTEVNSAPSLVNPGNVTIDELRGYTNFLVASDSDLPTNNLTFGLVAPFISGVQVVSTTGRLTWTPSETNGGGSVEIAVRVFDNGSPSMSATQRFTITVNEVNAAPVLTNLNNSIRTNAELTSIVLTNIATDSDSPTNVLTYEIVSAPAGATVNATNGVFNWTPNESQGPSSNSILVRVYDNGTSSLSATQRFSIVVTEVNSAPVLAPISDKTASPGQLLTFTNVVNDSDLPAQILTFSLAGNPSVPAGASLDSGTGVFTWTPDNSQSPSTNNLSVLVSDNGSPSLSATQNFTVIVGTATAFRITKIELISATQLKITWESVDGQTYHLEYRDDLNDPNPQTAWHTLQNSTVSASGSTASKTVDLADPTPHSQRFYRVAKGP